jgi:hypothetical protein
MVPSLDYVPAWPCPRKDELTISVERGARDYVWGAATLPRLVCQGLEVGVRVY